MKRREIGGILVSILTSGCIFEQNGHQPDQTGGYRLKIHNTNNRTYNIHITIRNSGGEAIFDETRAIGEDNSPLDLSRHLTANDVFDIIISLEDNILTDMRVHPHMSVDIYVESDELVEVWVNYDVHQ